MYEDNDGNTAVVNNDQELYFNIKQLRLCNGRKIVNARFFTFNSLTP